MERKKKKETNKRRKARLETFLFNLLCKHEGKQTSTSLHETTLQNHTLPMPLIFSLFTRLCLQKCGAKYAENWQAFAGFLYSSAILPTFFCRNGRKRPKCCVGKGTLYDELFKLQQFEVSLDHMKSSHLEKFTKYSNFA